MTELYTAPVQGHTDAAWRHFHHKIYATTDRYFTPFIRCEHGSLRPQDVRDATSDLNEGLNLEPQVIFRDMEELETLLSNLASQGFKQVNLNIGCPFPLQTGKGRGAAFIGNKEEMNRLPEILSSHPELSYSIKIRLGYEDPKEWRGAMDTFNSIKLRHIDVHPRVAKQQYGGELWLEEFGELLKESTNPVVYNGEVRTPEDASKVLDRFPGISGIMIARGILGRPSLSSEIRSGKEWSREERLGKQLDFHRQLLGHYSDTLCGETQVLSKIKPFWEYAEEEIGRKAWKAIKKASNMTKYKNALQLI